MTFPSFDAALLSVREHVSQPQHIEGLYHLRREAGHTEVVFTEPLVPSIRVFGFKLRTPNRSPRITKQKWRIPDAQLPQAPERALEELKSVLGQSC
jgi:hypothetical protein